QPPRRFDIRISTTMDGRPVIGAFRLYARQPESGEFKVAVRAEGVFRFASIAAGLYRLDGAPEGLYLKNLMIDGKARPDATLDLRSGPPATIEAIYSANVAQVEGRVEGAGELAVTVIRVDEEKSHIELVGDSVSPDQTGQFKMTSLAPGRYR